MALPQPPTMSVEEYLQLDRESLEARYEYIDGYVTMLAGGTPDHALISANVVSTLHSLLRGSPCRVYTSDVRVRLSESRYVYPDVVVSCDERDRGRIDMMQYPRLVVEVLSPSTAIYDRGQKFVYYRECPTIQEYVLIDTEHPSVEVFRRETQTLWTLHLFDLHDEVQLASLEVSFPVAAVYENIEFTSDDPHLA